MCVTVTLLFICKDFFWQTINSIRTIRLRKMCNSCLMLLVINVIIAVAIHTKLLCSIIDKNMKKKNWGSTSIFYKSIIKWREKLVVLLCLFFFFTIYRKCQETKKYVLLRFNARWKINGFHVCDSTVFFFFYFSSFMARSRLIF